VAALKYAIQWLTAGISKNQAHPSFSMSERQRLDCPSSIKCGCERVFVLQAARSIGRRIFFGQRQHQDS
jgi:hypothetical protein